MLGLSGVNPVLSSYIRQADRIIARSVPGLRLKVTSGYRSEAQQAQLRAQWAMGDRSGFTSEPAVVSAHSSGRAVDLAFVWQGRPIGVRDMPPGWFEALGSLLEPVGVYRVGLNHFETR